jgi:hypothetical protein
MVEREGEWSVLAVRVWVTALKLMQDDDEDIRDIVGTSINEIENTSVFQKDANNEITEIIYTKSYDSLKNFMPQNFTLVQGFMLDRMGFLISDALVWSLATNTTSMTSSGLHVVLTEYQRLIGTKEGTRAILQADGNTLNEKIFEAEQSNLHIEPLVGAHVLAVAVAETAKRLMSTTNIENHAFQEGRKIIIAAMNQYIQDAQSMLNEDQGDHEWVGGFSYQKDVFTYLYGALHLGVMGAMRCKECLDISVNMNHNIKSSTSHPWILNSLHALVSHKLENYEN